MIVNDQIRSVRRVRVALRDSHDLAAERAHAALAGALAGLAAHPGHRAVVALVVAVVVVPLILQRHGPLRRRVEIRPLVCKPILFT